MSDSTSLLTAESSSFLRKADLRRHFRRQRRKLTHDQQAHNAHALQRNLLRTLLVMRYQNFALYCAADGEINTHAIISKLWEYSKHTALPYLRHRDYSTKARMLQMQFAPFTARMSLVRGGYDLLEPAVKHLSTHPPFNADLIFLPLVAYDKLGTRLGMGGGYYDRYTSHRRHSKTLRVGLAHSLQESDQPLPRDEWDISLDAVITEQRAQAFNTRAHSLLFGTNINNL